MEEVTKTRSPVDQKIPSSNLQATSTWANAKREAFSIAGIVIFVLAIKSSFIANYTVPTGSMVPTIEVYDKLLVNKMAYDLRLPFGATTIPFTGMRLPDVTLYEFSKPERGDVIVFDRPQDRDISYVKRLIGLPGDVVVVENGVIKRVNGVEYTTSVSGEKLADILINGGTYEEITPRGSYTINRKSIYEVPRGRDSLAKEYRVPQGYYFVMGDNRDASWDSRGWGFVPHSHLRGKALMVYFSIEWEGSADWLSFDYRFVRVRTERFGKSLTL